jgi:putative SOS response-associated peptidase YedK
MCNLYSITSSHAAIRELARAMRDITENLAPLPAVYPDHLAPVVAADHEGQRALLLMRWGLPPPPSVVRPATNVRNTKSSWWQPWLSRPAHRCLVPVNSFCEYDHSSGKAVSVWFALDEIRSLFFFAGVWRAWHGTRGTKSASVIGEHLLFAFLTTEANAEVAPIHRTAMPVLLLDTEARETWLNGSTEDALRLQRPAPDGTLKIVRTGEKEDPEPDAHKVTVSL